LLLQNTADQSSAMRAVSVASALLSQFLDKDATFPADALTLAFPWARVLSNDERRSMATELVDAGIGGAALGDLRGFDLVYTQWRNTAEAKAAGVDLVSPIRSNVDYGSPRRPAPKKKAPPRARKA
jgi:hypothetical protein